jgi:hypothetical protein
MKAELRSALAREPFEEKIRKVEQLVRLAKEFPRRPRSKASVADKARAPGKAIIAAIRNRNILQFSYNGILRTVEPQTYGLSTTGREVLRARERPSKKAGKHSGMAKLFDLNKISGLQETGETFREALPEHNPNDNAIAEVFATLPKPKK